jgi:hypothetical protein
MMAIFRKGRYRRVWAQRKLNHRNEFFRHDITVYASVVKPDVKISAGRLILVRWPRRRAPPQSEKSYPSGCF